MRVILFTLAALLPLALGNSAAAQRPVPPEQMPLPNERVLQTPYWWAWGKPDDDVKRPLNVIGEAEAKALIEAFKSPHAAFVNARSYMFYEPGVILTQTFTTTLYTAKDQPEVRTTVTYFAERYAIKHVHRNTMIYRSPGSAVETYYDPDAPYARYRYIVEDYAGDRVVGVNLDGRGQVAECALLERAPLERPLVIWTLPYALSGAAQGRHVGGELYFIGDHVMISGDEGETRARFGGVIFEGKRLRPLSGRFNNRFDIQRGRMPPYEFAFAYDAAIPDFLSSPACQSDESVRLGYPVEINRLFGGPPPGEVRIARKSTVRKATTLRFALVADRPLNEVATAAQSAILANWGGALEGGRATSTRIYNYPAVRMVIRRNPSRFELDALQIAPDKVIVRGTVSLLNDIGGKK